MHWKSRHLNLNAQSSMRVRVNHKTWRVRATLRHGKSKKTGIHELYLNKVFDPAATISNKKGMARFLERVFVECEFMHVVDGDDDPEVQKKYEIEDETTSGIVMLHAKTGREFVLQGLTCPC